MYADSRMTTLHAGVSAAWVQCSRGIAQALFRALRIGRATMYRSRSLYRQGEWGALDARKRGERKPKLAAPQIG